MEDLPTELTIDILSRLPVKTIIHCKLVCKKWLNLVSDPSFVNLHLSISPKGLIIHRTKPSINMIGKTCVSDDPGILKWVEIEDKVDCHHLHYDRLLSLDLNLAPSLQYTAMRHVGSVNGLICLWQYFTMHDNTYICNPVTREYMLLPRQRFRIEFYAAIVYGFGVSSLTGEYKVVRTFQEQHGLGVVQAEVYTLGTGRWRTLGPVGYWRNEILQFYGPFLNNHCHWIVNDNQICTFDLDKETFQFFPSPPSVEVNHGQSLGILKGCLCKLDTDYSELTIWVMKEYRIKNSWHKQVVEKRQTIQWPKTQICWSRTLINPSMEDLPAELTIDILSRLPVKTIILCKLVCNKWRNLVSDPFFVNLHLSGSPTVLIVHHTKPPINMGIFLMDIPNNPGILNWVEIGDSVGHLHLHRDPLMSLDLSLAPILQNSHMHQVGSVNGLICLWEYDYKADNTYICNPVTREYMILPRQRFQKPGFSAKVVYGFGVSSLTGEYKVVRAFQGEILPNAKKPSHPSLIEVEVYTLGTGRWRSRGPVPAPYPLNAFDNFFYGIFLNNHCHWIVCGVEDKIGTFDFDKETFQSIPSHPLVEENHLHLRSLAILRGCLCVLDTGVLQSTIWVMKEYGIKNSWHKEVVITQDIIVGLVWRSFESIQLIEGLKGGM
ncbi:hypothetical protein OSB04_016198 [Centaurea solstitialis]|uniref:F-box domain-containing protein n=1 Tax=Centaurea solstitialis TaxID=347529 RepID=A0AA38T879_9ASTR|nr:hypothetical protein OSB04_016198 [Centaurea solstitialis]